MPEPPATPVPEATPGLVRTSTNALALTQRTSVAVSLTQQVQREASAAYWFERGLAATQATRWDEAAHAYRQCVERDAEHWRAGVRLAEALGQLGQVEEAANALVEASEASIESDEVTVYGWNAARELPKQTLHRLRGCLEAARSTAQNGFGLLLGLTLVYRALKLGGQARRTLDTMHFMHQQQVAGSAQWFRLSGNLYSDEKWNVQAIADYSRAIELKPKDALAYCNRGKAKADLEDYSGAIIDYDCAIKLKPNDVAIYYNREEANCALRDYAGAIADYDRIIELEPDALAYSNRACFKERLGDYTGAIADCDQAIELESYYLSVRDYYNQRAGYKKKVGDTAGAAADRAKAAELEAAKNPKA